jgi:hypothetical protein
MFEVLTTMFNKIDYSNRFKSILEVDLRPVIYAFENSYTL